MFVLVSLPNAASIDSVENWRRMGRFECQRVAIGPSQLSRLRDYQVIANEKGRHWRPYPILREDHFITTH